MAPHGDAMTVEAIMSRRVVTVEFDDRLALVKEIFDATGFRHVLVVENEKLYGVVSDRDLLRALSPYIGSATECSRDTDTLNKRVHQVMSRKPITLHANDEISGAIKLLLDNRISCIPIVDDDFKPIGIVSLRDILQWFSEKL